MVNPTFPKYPHASNAHTQVNSHPLGCRPTHAATVPQRTLDLLPYYIFSGHCRSLINQTLALIHGASRHPAMANSQTLLLRLLAVNVAVVRGKLPLVCSNVSHAAWVSFFPIHALATPCTYFHRHLYACSAPTLPLYRRLLAFEQAAAGRPTGPDCIRVRESTDHANPGLASPVTSSR